MSTTVKRPAGAKRTNAEVAEEVRLGEKRGQQFRVLSTLLYQAADTDEDPVGTGYSDRLLRMAGDVAQAAGEVNWIGGCESMGPAEHKAFDIAALVDAAMRVPGDPCSEIRKALLDQIKAILVEMTEADDCLDLAPSPDAQLTERLDLAMDAATEIKSWLSLIAPVSKQAIFDAGMSGDTPDWHALASTVFARIDTLANAIFYAQDPDEFPTKQFRQCVIEGKSVEETHWEADLMATASRHREANHA